MNQKLSSLPDEVIKRAYIALYKNRRILVEAKSSYDAQLQAAALVKAKKSYDVTVYLADQPINTASL